MIDCCLPSEDFKKRNKILAEIKHHYSKKCVARFISTHPDQDHFTGLKEIDKQNTILNFYCVKNEASKEDETEDFKHYCVLRDNKDKAFYLYRGCERKWMNISDSERGCAGLNILWPIPKNINFKNALEIAKNGGSPNNISPIISYSRKNGATALWM
ncbi:MAG: hypothetical protein OXF49_03460 [Candidatus Saccharibacteria bacterium]|nr:hypothetical protein [Candidatus Saccharibacteria bacterium]